MGILKINRTLTKLKSAFFIWDEGQEKTTDSRYQSLLFNDQLKAIKISKDEKGVRNKCRSVRYLSNCTDFIQKVSVLHLWLHTSVLQWIGQIMNCRV